MGAKGIIGVEECFLKMSMMFENQFAYSDGLCCDLQYRNWRLLQFDLCLFKHDRITIKQLLQNDNLLNIFTLLVLVRPLEKIGRWSPAEGHARQGTRGENKNYQMPWASLWRYMKKSYSIEALGMDWF